MSASELTIKVVETAEEQMKAFLVRGIVYMHEQNCPYTEEFDQNDFAATQILGMMRSEPVLTARIRYFDSFAKLERVAVRPQFRGQGYGHKLLRYMMDFCFQKGFKTLYLHANTDLLEFYKGYGFQPIGESFNFSDHNYVEMVLSYSQSPRGTVSLDDDPLIINRPEGKWHLQGPQEESLQRFLKSGRPLKIG